MSEPRTEAGKRLLREILPGKPPFLSEIVPLRSILAIEAEAAAPSVPTAELTVPEWVWRDLEAVESQLRANGYRDWPDLIRNARVAMLAALRGTPEDAT